MHIRYFKSYTDFQIVNFDVGKKLYKYKIQKNSTFFLESVPYSPVSIQLHFCKRTSLLILKFAQRWNL